MLLENIHRLKNKAESDYLLQLRFACITAVINGRDLKTCGKVQRKIADVLNQIYRNHPSKEFEDKYILKAGELGDGFAIRVAPDYKSISIFQTNSPNVVAIGVDFLTQYQREAM